MGKRKLLRMQQHRLHTPFFQEELVLLVAAVGPVADDGVEDVVAMAADLMGAAGQWSCFDQGVAGGGVFAKGNGYLGFVQPLEYGHRIAGFAFMIGDGIVDFDLFGKPASDNGEVPFVHLPGMKFILDGPGHLRIEGKEEDTTRLPVDPMTGVHMFSHQLTAQDLYRKLLRVQGQVGPMDE